jgi:hypothetical protein
LDLPLVLAALLAGLGEPRRIAGGVPALVNPQQLEIGVDRLERPDEAEEPGALVLAVQPGVGLERQAEGGPAIAEALREDTVAVDE